MRILLIEDDELIAETLTTTLAQQNYIVEVARDGQLGWELVEAYDYDLVLMDVLLPKLDGFNLCRRIRSQGYRMPILLLTALDSGEDKTTGLDAGADDYVVKPFNLPELVARVRALLRRGNTSTSPLLEWGSLQLDPITCEVTYVTQPLSLTPKEYALLELFLRNGRRVFSCGAILEHLWSFEDTPGEEAVRTHIKGLRQKLKAVGAPADLVETVYGIGYRLKPIERLEAEPETPKATEPGKGKARGKPVEAAAAPAASELAHRQRMLAAVAQVFDRFKQRFQEQIGLLEQAAIALIEDRLSPDLQQQARQEAHTLAGSLGTFGYSGGSQIARQIERLLQTKLPRDRGEDLRHLVVHLREQLEQPMAIPGVDQVPTSDRPSILVIHRDQEFIGQLGQEADLWGMGIVAASSLTQARQQVDQSSPQAVLLDMAIAAGQDCLQLLKDLSSRTPPLPVLALTTTDRLDQRLEVARCGGRAFLLQPISPAQVLQAVQQVSQQHRTSARVLAVDDDRATLTALRALLQPWGLHLTTLEDPRQFWETLEVTQPDLLVLDVEMPHMSGVELCQIVRSDPRWSGLPILFLTAHIDSATVQQVFTAGADDYVTKPILGPELITRMMNRLERMHLLRTVAETDSLTRVANRHKSTQALQEFLHLAERHQQPLCFVLLDLDYFKQVNDRYGHATGDEVLRQLGQLLLQSFRGEDVVGRWAGEEFVIGMYGLTCQEGMERLAELLQTLRKFRFSSTTATTRIQVTCSAGIAQYPQDGGDLHSLYQAADRALTAAKQAGRDRILPSNPNLITSFPCPAPLAVGRPVEPPL